MAKITTTIDEYEGSVNTYKVVLTSGNTAEIKIYSDMFWCFGKYHFRSCSEKIESAVRNNWVIDGVVCSNIESFKLKSSTPKIHKVKVTQTLSFWGDTHDEELLD